MLGQGGHPGPPGRWRIIAAVPDTIQRITGLLGAVVTLPLVAALALAVRLDSPGPALYPAVRVGEGGRTFRCHKLRTMTWAGPEAGSGVTVAADRRLTRIGRLLRRYRLDELPQLWNVAVGEMRLVGPRPEAPRFVDLSLPLHREVFAARPGITGLTQLLYADEAAMLDPVDPERQYRESILPAKLRIDAAYLRHRSTRLDLWILAQTPRALSGRAIVPPPVLRRELADA
jgi:lipopolysaccharide/colanic/teichoic acid biosynthesis glycosyltransferase